ncbi:hypothetical protein HDU93_001540, partial [Gonapodya sp. JEL0774]
MTTHGPLLRAASTLPISCGASSHLFRTSKPVSNVLTVAASRASHGPLYSAIGPATAFPRSRSISSASRRTVIDGTDDLGMSKEREDIDFFTSSSDGKSELSASQALTWTLSTRSSLEAGKRLALGGTGVQRNSGVHGAFRIAIGSSGLHTLTRTSPIPFSPSLPSQSVRDSSASHSTSLASSVTSSPSISLTRRHQSQVSFVQKFRESIRRQVEENKEFQEGVKQLSENTQQIADSDAMQRAKQAAQVTGQAAGKVVEAMEKVLESDAAKKAAEVVIKVAEPIVDNPATRAAASAAKSVHESVQDPNSTATLRYHELKPAADREKDFFSGKVVPLEDMLPPVKPNEEATGVVVDQKSRAQKQWEEWRESNPIYRAWFDVTKTVEE